MTGAALLVSATPRISARRTASLGTVDTSLVPEPDSVAVRSGGLRDLRVGPSSPTGRRAGLRMPPEELADRVARVLGKQVAGWHATIGGYTAADRLVFNFRDGSSAFVKAAAHPVLADRLRVEQRAYSELSGDFMARLLAWDDDGQAPLMVLEDLSQGWWPPPWRPADIGRVLDTLEQLRRAAPPASFLPFRRESLGGWVAVARAPEAFLNLGMVSKDWLAQALPALLDAEAAAPLEGSEPVHLDIRSDNVCFLPDRVVFVDWDHACLGNGLFDVASWLPSLHAEGGPKPWDLLPGAAGVASFISGYFAARAGLPPSKHAPEARSNQRQQLRTALPWAARELGLPIPPP